MKIGTKVYTNKNGTVGYGVIVEKRTIKYFNTVITLFKVSSKDFGIEWINKDYLIEVKE